MSDDHILLADIIESADINAKQLSGMTGRGKSTIYKYLSGECTIPSIVWRVLWEKTQDLRIVWLVTGDKRMIVIPVCSGGKADLGALHEVHRLQTEAEAMAMKVMDILEKQNMSGSATVKNDCKKRYNKMLVEQIKFYETLLGDKKNGEN